MAAKVMVANFSARVGAELLHFANDLLDDALRFCSLHNTPPKGCVASPGGKTPVRLTTKLKNKTWEPSGNSILDSPLLSSGNYIPLPQSAIVF